MRTISPSLSIVKLTLLLFLFTALGCSKDDDAKADQYDVYPFGKFSDKAAYWKNGKLVDLGTETGSFLSCGTVSGSDIYFGGYNNSANGSLRGGTVWKNGVGTPLLRSTYIQQIVVAGSDFYIAGQGRTSTGKNVCMIWKNGQQIKLGDSTSYAGTTTGIAISGSDIHVVGWEAQNDSVVARYWKNGKIIKLPVSNKYTFLNSIAIVGSDVYIGGSESDGSNNAASRAKLWKNGAVDTSVNNFGEITKIISNSSDLYFAGAAPGATYWSNKSPVVISGQLGSEDVVKINSDLFVVTYTYTTTSFSSLFKNDQPVSPFNGTDSNIYLNGLLVQQK
jgi:hypothetical protein